MLLRAMAGSVTLLQLGSVLMSVTGVTTNDYADVPGLGCHLSPSTVLSWPYSQWPSYSEKQFVPYLGSMGDLGHVELK